VLLRLVFILYAEDRGLLADDPVYQSSYALTGLFAQLREDAARYPDTMEQRYGAWARVLVLFRLVHDGASHGAMRLPARYGRLFDPDVYPFLEGRSHRSLRQRGARVEVPKVSDGVVYRVLDSLLMLGGERLSYRALDVEQIGSVYEAMMGFALDTAAGPSIAVKPQHVVVDLGALVKRSGAERVKSLADEAGCKLPAAQAERVKAAKTVEELVAALDKRVSARTPRVIPAGAMFLQPGEERRRSGSHYTPRSLTEPIVRTTLRPVLEALCASPRPEAILALKVCDPAMGSGAFLVEACRALGDVLVASWQAHGLPDDMPEGEDPVLHARRLVARGASTASTRIPSRSTSRGSRSGSSRSPRTTPSPSSITRCARAIRSWACRASRSRVSTGRSASRSRWCAPWSRRPCERPRRGATRSTRGRWPTTWARSAGSSTRPSAP
jgi:N-6 DNA Methylase